MSNNNSGGIGVVGALGIVFVILKLVGVITWDWIWVLAPFWIGIALWLLILAGVGIVWLVLHASDSAENRKRRKAATALRNYGKSLR